MNFEKKSRYILITLMLLLYLIFMITILIDYNHSVLLMLFATIITFCVLIACYKLPIHYDHYATDKRESIFLSLWIPAAALLTFFLNNSTELGIVLIASMIGTVAAFLPLFLRKYSFVRQMPEAIYCGAFVGMTSYETAQSYLFILIAGLFTAVLYFMLRVFFRGVGGKLGSIAFGGVFFASLLYFISQ